MGSKYTTNTPSGYNASPPSDDGSATESNRGYWATIISKVGGPLYNWISAIDTALVTFADVGPSAKSSAYTTVAGDHLKTIEVTGTTTITLGAVASMGAGYTVTITNNGANTVTVDGSGSETINGVANFTLPANCTVTVQVDSTASNYYILHFGGLPSTVATLGTVEASKNVTVDSNKDVTGFRNVTGTGTATFAALAGPLTGTASNASALNSQAASYYLSRTNHTGTQTLSTISDAGTWAAISALPAGAVTSASLTYTTSTESSYSIAGSSEQILPAGIYLYLYDAGTTSIPVDLLISRDGGSTWVSTPLVSFTGTSAKIVGPFFSDGTNIKLNRTTSGGFAVIYFKKWA